MNKLAKERRGEWRAEKSSSPLLADLKAEADAVKTQSKKLLLLLLVFDWDAASSNLLAQENKDL